MAKLIDVEIKDELHLNGISYTKIKLELKDLSSMERELIFKSANELKHPLNAGWVNMFFSNKILNPTAEIISYR